MTWFKLISIISIAVGLGAGVILLKKYIQKVKKFKTYSKGVQELIKKTTKGSLDSKDSTKTNFDRKSYRALRTTLINHYSKDNKQASIILFNGDKFDMLEEFNLKENEIFTLDNLFVFIDRELIRFIICLEQEFEPSNINLAIAELKKMIKKLYYKAVINLPTLQVCFSEKNNLSNNTTDNYTFYLKKISNSRLFKNLSCQVINLNKIPDNEFEKQTLNALQKQDIFKNYFYIQEDKSDIKDDLISIQKNLIFVYIFLSFRNNEDIFVILKQFHKLNQVIEKQLQQENLDSVISALPSKQPIYINLINDHKIYKNDINIAPCHWSHNIIGSFIIVISLAMSLAMISNYHAIYKNNQSVRPLINNKISSLNNLESFYNQTSQNLNKSLWFNSIYPKYKLYKNFDNETAKRAWSIIAKQAKNSKFIFKKLAMTLLLISNDQPQIKHYIKSNIQTWAKILGISPEFLTNILDFDSKVKLNKQIIFNNHIIKLIIQNMSSSLNQNQFISSFIKQNKTTININQLESLLFLQYQDHLIFNQLKQVLPLVSTNNIKRNSWLDINNWIEMSNLM